MRKKERGFSLIEITLALAVLAISIVVCLGVLSVGLSDSRQASEHLLIGLILQEAQGQIEGRSLKVGDLEGSPFFYTADGEMIDDQLEVEKFYRLDISLAKPSREQLPTDAPGLLAVKMVLKWPVDGKTGIPKSTEPSKVHQTLLVGTHAGSDWTAVDPGFQPKIEF